MRRPPRDTMYRETLGRESSLGPRVCVAEQQTIVARLRCALGYPHDPRILLGLVCGEHHDLGRARGVAKPPPHLQGSMSRPASEAATRARPSSGVVGGNVARELNRVKSATIDGAATSGSL